MRRLLVVAAVLGLLPAALAACAPDLATDAGAAVREVARFIFLRPAPHATAALPAATRRVPPRTATVWPDTPTARGAGRGSSSTATTGRQPGSLAAPPPQVPAPAPVTRIFVPPTATELPTPTEPPTTTPDAMAALGVPIRLELPSIGVSALVEQVGITQDRRMAVPSSWDRVAWFKHGFRPGEPGNAVVAGHLDTSSGGPAVFWNLDKLAPGDEAIVHYSNGDRLVFVVQGSAIYDYDASGPSIEQIFGPALTANLNLITCEGAWDHGRATYTKRLVVFTTLAPERTMRAGEPATYQMQPTPSAYEGS